MFNNSDEHSQAEIPLIKYSYHTDTQSLATVRVRMCVPVVGSSGPEFAVAQSSQKADDLDGFSQSHFISQDATCLLTVEFPHPPHTCLLVPDDVIKNAVKTYNLYAWKQLWIFMCTHDRVTQRYVRCG